ncbi:MAG: hypothetical protein ACOZF0_08755 [Thermodesulfobacteriota bacterium]
MNAGTITVIDQTLREGMQYRGLVFSLEERLRILEFQEALGVDISQAGYPSAHVSEFRAISRLRETAEKRGYGIRLAALGRALPPDVERMTAAGVQDIHLHVALAPSAAKDRVATEAVFTALRQAVGHVRTELPDSRTGVSVLDIGRADMGFLTACAELLIHELRIDLLTLPDTSGLLWPGRLYETVRKFVAMTEQSATRIGVHCHNDMGMATANTVTGVSAGARVMEVTALGIGERNGIGDLFLTGRCLAEQGYHLNLKTAETDLFRQYYAYVDEICFKKTGVRLMDDRTPFFGRDVRTHVAGTHGGRQYGVQTMGADYCLNVLCGKALVEKFLAAHQLDYDPELLSEIVRRIKDLSADLCGSVSVDQVAGIIRCLADG